jgi:hypothetical protein
VTRSELDQLRTVFAALGQSLTRLGDMIIEAQRALDAEDTHHTALEEQSHQGAAHDKFRPL